MKTEKEEEIKRRKNASRQFEIVNTKDSTKLEAELSPYCEALAKLADSQDESGNYLVNMININSLLKALEKADYEKFAEAFQKFPNHRVNLVQFVRTYIQIANLKENERLLLISAALTDFFINQAQFSHTPFLPWKIFSENLLRFSLEYDSDPEYSLSNKYLWKRSTELLRKTISPRQLSQLRPQIIGRLEARPLYFRKDNKITDSERHLNGIRSIYYLASIKIILCLDQLCSYFLLYNIKGKLIKRVQLNPGRHAEDTRIFGIAWSGSEKRIGACMQDHTLSFWDWGDEFSYEHCIDASDSSIGYVTNIVVKNEEQVLYGCYISSILLLYKNESEILKLNLLKYSSLKYLNHISCASGKVSLRDTTGTEIFFSLSDRIKPLDQFSASALRRDSFLNFYSQKEDQTKQIRFPLFIQLITFSNIWYIEYCDTWLTCDSECIFHIWDIYTEKKKALTKHHTQPIIALVEAPIIPAIILSSLDKKILIWDISTERLLSSLEMDVISMHSLAFSQLHQVMFSAGFDTQIYMWKFGHSLDITLARKIEGHSAQITSLLLQEESGTMITTDEIGFIKSWNILSLQCIQTLYIESRVPLSRGLLLDSNHFILAANRIYFFFFDKEKDFHSEKLELNNNEILDLQFSEKREEFYICTPQCVRAYSAFSGQCKRIYSGVAPLNEDITAMCFTSDQNRIAIADTSGTVTYRSLTSNTSLKTTKHSSPTLFFHSDPLSGLITTVTQNNLLIERDSENEILPLRQLTGKSSEISLACVSDYLNLIAIIFQIDIILYIIIYC